MAPLDHAEVVVALRSPGVPVPEQLGRSPRQAERVILRVLLGGELRLSAVLLRRPQQDLGPPGQKPPQNPAQSPQARNPLRPLVPTGRPQLRMLVEGSRDAAQAMPPVPAEALHDAGRADRDAAPVGKPSAHLSCSRTATLPCRQPGGLQVDALGRGAKPHQPARLEGRSVLRATVLGDRYPPLAATESELAKYLLEPGPLGLRA